LRKLCREKLQHGSLINVELVSLFPDNLAFGQTTRAVVDRLSRYSLSQYGPASRICYLQANEIVKTTARDYQERQMAQRFR
jgi:hypothetical protein